MGAVARGQRVHARFVEVYRGQVYDLLNARARLEVNEGRDGTVHFASGTEVQVETAEALLGLVKRAEEQRAGTWTHGARYTKHADANHNTALSASPRAVWQWARLPPTRPRRDRMPSSRCSSAVRAARPAAS